ncbi:hypothetical protein CASFOL_040843 [Castilleja foliolosa]|uniref:Gnk2-homologous domain-containing protein n=1 Tax=Castilleja foliolosa TaxID=1961234 RepID=A0ABD3BEC3_9LAMI
MSCNNNYLITTILIITIVYFLNIIPIAFSIEEDTELAYNCLSSDKNFTSNYNQTLVSLLNDLTNNTPLHGGYFKATYESSNNSDDSAYGHALCRGDLSPDECHACAQNASNTLIDTTHCPDSRSAIIYRAHCMVKYMDDDFLGKPDFGNAFIMTSTESWESGVSISTTRNLMVSLNSAINSVMYYASMTSTYPYSNLTLQGMVQCTGDVNITDCNECLRSAIFNLDFFDQGARVLKGSCNIRYEIYNFLK